MIFLKKINYFAVEIDEDRDQMHGEVYNNSAHIILVNVFTEEFCFSQQRLQRPLDRWMRVNTNYLNQFIEMIRKA